jgi:hypothetical protein
LVDLGRHHLPPIHQAQQDRHRCRDRALAELPPRDPSANAEEFTGRNLRQMKTFKLGTILFFAHRFSLLIGFLLII